ncbi:DUF6263 family protein [Robiginitalea sp. M366]|uniref:DUF6263 family protein n=1 Tax=Robiginitalea aestuariiviva TaxID=3036903 RepID=UPI00240E3573|nr:DUF6263 family protein [Robiginitalea aestuariiviva]MDG1573481.1 DUF6263 family protein [Robiginitalea aestuariiviva]
MFLVLLTGSAGICTGQQPLGYQWKKGDVFTVEQRSLQEMEQQLQGDTHKVSSTVSALLEFRVIAEGAASSILEMAYRDLFFHIDSSLKGELLDIHARELDSSNVHSRIFHSMLDTPVRLEVDPQGHILQVWGGDSLINRMVARAGIETALVRTQVRKSLESQYGPEALAASCEQLTLIYPKKQAVAGATWETRAREPHGGSHTWTLEHRDTDQWVISGEGEVRMNETQPGSEMRLSGQQHCRILADAQTGFPKEMRVEGHCEGFSTMAETGGLKIPTQVKTQVTYTLIDHRHVQ